MDKAHERALIRRCQQGDRQAMDVLLSHYEKPVYNAAYRMLGNRDDAADVTQTVFLKVFENIRSFDAAQRFFSWIYRIAMNESIDQVRQRGRVSQLDDEPAGSGDPSRAGAERDQVSHELQAVLLELNEDQRAVIVLRYFTECDYHEIGATLGIPEKTVKSRLFSARREMRRRLRRHGVLSS